MGRTGTWFYLLLSICLVIFFLAKGNTVYAETGTNAISVSPLNPVTNEPQSNYYDFKVNPEENKQFAIREFNSREKDTKVKVELNDASTNDNGITSYLGQKKRDSTLKVGFSDIASTKASVVNVPAKGSMDIPIKVTMPKEKFVGVILGGIRITEMSDETTAKNAAVVGKVGYTVGVVLRESDEPIKPVIKLNDVSIEQRNYRNYISANLQNTKPTMVKSLAVKADIYAEDQQKVYSAERDGMRMAPNSNFNFGIQLENQKFVAGKYTVKISGSADDVPFAFEREFEILKSEATKYNKDALFVKDSFSEHYWWYFVIGVDSCSLLTGLAVLFFVKRKATK